MCTRHLRIARAQYWIHMKVHRCSHLSRYYTYIVAPQRIWKWGHRSDAKRRKKILLVVSLHFLALKAQLVVLVSAFVMVSTVWSVSCLLFFYWRCPPCPAICKSGGTCPPPVRHGVGATGFAGRTDHRGLRNLVTVSTTPQLQFRWTDFPYRCPQDFRTLATLCSPTASYSLFLDVVLQLGYFQSAVSASTAIQPKMYGDSRQTLALYIFYLLYYLLAYLYTYTNTI